MIEKIIQIWKVRDLRQKILFVLGMLVIYRLAAHIPVPGVNPAALKDLFSGNQILGLLNVFSGGSMQNFSIVMMGVAPYITASIIFQLLGMIVPALEEMQKEESGQAKINMWTRWLTVPLAALQAFGMITLIRRSTGDVIGNITTLDFISMIIVISAGTIFLMWMGELITEKKIGNGISLLIFAGIVSSLPQSIMQFFIDPNPNKITMLLAFSVVAIATVIGVVYITEAQRNVPVQYAKQIRGKRMLGGSSTHLPLRINMAGVIPIIFAISVIMFPSMIAQFFVNAKSEWLRGVAAFTIDLFQNNQIFYGVSYFLLVFAFTYFYTEVIFHPTQIAENLQKQGGFIPGIRPGKHTSNYLANTTHKIIFVGALFLGIIAVMPLLLRFFFEGRQFLAIGGTSLLIVVAVVIEIVKQIESQMTMREYEGM